MSFDEFDEFMNRLQEEINTVLSTKGQEYTASMVDRFANFQQLGEDLDIAPLEVAYIYYRKHLNAILSYIISGKVLSNESIRGRFIDLIGYSFLMAGMAEEKERKNEVLQEASDRTAGHLRVPRRPRTDRSSSAR